ncbi:helix-turn-helix domain-containing protein [Mycolicibacterium litorale]|uniref:helix-turn-helix domain-containing protein n=1 Tax=Mycolicibacterium litorale TaxID=758802 RepID=UPI003CEF7A0A
MEPQWERLGEYVAARRKNRGWSQAAVADRGGPSDTLQSRIEAGDWRPTRGVAETLKKIDAGLEWAEGSASRVLDGGEPTPLNRDGRPRPPRQADDSDPEDDPAATLEALVDQGWRTAHELTNAVAATEQPSDDLLAASRDAIHFIAATLIIDILRSSHASKMDQWLRRLYVEREDLYRRLSVGEPRFPWLTMREVAERERSEKLSAANDATQSDYDLANRDTVAESEGRRRRNEQDRDAEHPDH